ncbi:hypothetical protein [Pseudomonas sp. LB3P38]|uniref:hypothetical protein n=1 Tax=Pseudomonas lyxosi TaxID=3398358 RepID=UPI0039F0727D
MTLLIAIRKWIAIVRAMYKSRADSSCAAAQKKTTSCELYGERKRWRAVPSSKFISYSAQLNAYNEAMTRETRKMSRFTGEDSKGNLVVRMEAENVGQGYEPNPLDPENPRFIPQMNAFEMKFDFETLQPLALYPIEKI